MFTQMKAQVYFQFLSQVLAAEHELSMQLNKDKGVYVPTGDRMRRIADDLYDVISAQVSKLEAEAKAEARDAKIHNDLVASGKLVEFPGGRPA